MWNHQVAAQDMLHDSRHTNFHSVRETMTVSGTPRYFQVRVQDLRSLILAALGVSDDYPEDTEISVESTGGKRMTRH